MKRIFLVAAYIMGLNACIFVNAQKIETVKTNTKMNDGGNLELSYSYYLDADGKEIRHGAFRAKSTEVEPKTGATGTTLIECIYKDGVLEGKFHFAQHTKAYIGQRVMTSLGIVVKVVAQPGLDVNEDITFNVYHGRMTGALNFSTKASGVLHEFHGNVQNGIVVDGTDFTYKSNGEIEISRNFKSATSPNLNLLSVSKRNKSLQFTVPYWDAIYVDFPLYVGMNLEDLSEYQEVLKIKETDEELYAIKLQDIASNYKETLSPEMLAQLKAMSDEVFDRIAAEREAARKKAEEERKQYEALYQTYNALFKKCSILTKAPKMDERYLMDDSAPNGWIPLWIDQHVESIIIDKYSLGMKSVVDFFQKGIQVSKNVDSLKQQVANFEWEQYLPLQDTCYIIKWQATKIELFYTKGMTHRETPYNMKREDCGKKIVKKKILYTAYCEIAEYLDAQITEGITIDGYAAIIHQMAVVSQRLYDGILEDTEELEKNLKKIKTVEEKIHILAH